MRVVINVVTELVVVKALNYQGITYYRVLLALIGGFVLNYSSRRLFLNYLLWGIRGRGLSYSYYYFLIFLSLIIRSSDLLIVHSIELSKADNINGRVIIIYMYQFLELS
jgi:hypothetical protein